MISWLKTYIRNARGIYQLENDLDIPKLISIAYYLDRNPQPDLEPGLYTLHNSLIVQTPSDLPALEMISIHLEPPHATHPTRDRRWLGQFYIFFDIVVLIAFIFALTKGWYVLAAFLPLFLATQQKQFINERNSIIKDCQMAYEFQKKSRNSDDDPL